MNITSSFFDTAPPFMPHGHCYLWSKGLVTLHIVSDALIVLAYYSIPITLLYFIRKRKDIEFHWMFACFALFILACGTTHLMEIWNIWHADYWLSGSIKALTAAASVPTAILLVKLVPQALTLPSARELKQARDELELRVAERTQQLKLTNDTLTREADERRRAEQTSRESEARLRAVLDSTPNAVVVINPKGHIIDWNAQAERIFGWSRAEALDRDLTETIIPKPYREAHRRGMAHLLATGEGPARQRAMEMSAARRDGTEFPVELFITPVKTQTTTNYCGFITDLTARKQAEKELRESQNLLQAVIENSPTVIYAKDLEGRYLLANRRFVELFLPSRESITGKTDYDFFTRPQAEAFRAMDSRVIVANQPLTEEEVAPHSDGLHTYMSVKCPLRDETGKAYAIFGLSTDITERKRAEERLQASLKEVTDLKAALDEHAIVAITDHQGKITYVNDKFCAISKYPREELLGQDHRLINSGYHPKEFIQGLWTTIAQGKVWKGEIKNRAKDGSFYWVATTIVPFLNEEGKPRHYVAIRADITEKKIAEERLQASLKEVTDLKAALDEHAIVAITDPQGRITYVNDKFCAISKYPREELLGQDHRLINSGYHPKEFIQGLWTTIAQGKVWKGEIKNRAKDGSFYWVATTIVPFLNEEGKPRHYVAIRADITEKKIAEEQIHSLNTELEQRVAERTAELESFSYSISHDLRAPLRAMGGYARMLQEDIGRQLPPAAFQKLDRIYENANKMGQLIDGLLAFSRLNQQALKKQRIQTTELARRVWDELYMERGTRPIQITINPLPECQADATLLHQVFVNLISNAIKYSRQREPAVVEVGWDQMHQAYFVKDNGAGFDMQYAGKLFGVFQRLHRADEFEGTGVGLAIVQRIVYRHGGKIWAQAKPDRGATFSFTLTEEHSHGE